MDVKGCSPSLIVREMHSKRQGAVTSHLSEWLASATQATTVGEDAEKREASCTVGGTAEWCGQDGGSPKIKNRGSLVV